MTVEIRRIKRPPCQNSLPQDSKAALQELRINQRVVQELERELAIARSDVISSRHALKWAVDAENEIKASIEAELRTLDASDQ